VEESVDSLKIVHKYFDNPEVATIMITNHQLDAAKTNRAINVCRPQPTCEDLKIVAQGHFYVEFVCLHLLLPTTKGMPSDEQHWAALTLVNFWWLLVVVCCYCFGLLTAKVVVGCSMVNGRNCFKKGAAQTVIMDGLCEAYFELKQSHKDSRMFELRDFYHLLRYIRRNSMHGAITADLVIRGLNRNFNGISKKEFKKLVHIFSEKLKGVLPIKVNSNTSILETLTESLNDTDIGRFPL